ncbi:RNA-binding protein [Ralstonia syzygii]|uniref:Conserved hypothethical protein n=1 Tax=Ralstonia syzygii R24 TaxID=907261 RepID=G3ABN6_9RALS|nr:RNA-binding protein [Ralstonia syzygii]CCA86941.1 conserved hypothethical protein [Ralstonia syzygii R24]
MKLLVSGLHPKATAGELSELIFRYTRATCGDIQLIGEGDAHPAALVDIKGATWITMNIIRRRLHGMYWHRCRINVQTLSFWDASNAAEAKRQERAARSGPPAGC